jgi:hypothetical protein
MKRKLIKDGNLGKKRNVERKHTEQTRKKKKENLDGIEK